MYNLKHLLQLKLAILSMDVFGYLILIIDTCSWSDEGPMKI